MCKIPPIVVLIRIVTTIGGEGLTELQQAQDKSLISVHCVTCSCCVVSIWQMYSNAGLIAILANVKDCKQGRSKQAYKGGCLASVANKLKAPARPFKARLAWECTNVLARQETGLKWACRTF